MKNNIKKQNIDSINARVKALSGRIHSLAGTSILGNPGVTLLGASKGQGVLALEEAISAGLESFGENRVQEAQEKWVALRSRYPSVSLHLIGPLQSNKARQAVELFDVIQTVDREKLADALADAMKKTGHTVECYVQVNTGDEPQKAGVSPKNADALIAYCKALGLPLVGLMCVPPADQPPAPHFALLRDIAARHDLPELSMGMSEDFEEAIRMGSTCVRIGRALFGERI